jgi:putative transposase
MTNHVHLVAVPDRPDALARGLGRAHFLYTRDFHLHHASSGHLWQNRFFSTALGPHFHLFTALRYVDLNPVRAGIVNQAEAYRWSSARAHLTGQDSSRLLDMASWREICESDACLGRRGSTLRPYGFGRGLSQNVAAAQG